MSDTLLALTAHGPALGLCAVCFVLAALLDSWERRAAQQAEGSTNPTEGDTAA